MNWKSCSQLNEVRDALAQGHWPDACAPELRAHVAACNRCAQEILLTQHLHRDRIAAVSAAQPGAASLLWWRAQARRRNAALQRAGRPLAAAQFFALLTVVAAIVGFVALHWRNLVDHATAAPASSLSNFVGDWGLAPLIFALLVITTLGGVVVYLTSERQ